MNAAHAPAALRLNVRIDLVRPARGDFALPSLGLGSLRKLVGDRRAVLGPLLFGFSLARS